MKRFLTLGLLYTFIISIQAAPIDIGSSTDSLIAEKDLKDGDLFYYDQQSKFIVIVDDSLLNEAVLIVYNISGLVVIQKKLLASKIKLEGIKSGIYLVAIKSKQYSGVKKIFVK